LNYLPRYQRCTSNRQWNQDGESSHSCGWLYVEKKVDKLSPGSLKAWAGRSTHSSRPLLLSLPPVSLLSSSTFFTDTPPPPPPPPFAPSSSSDVICALSAALVRLLFLAPCVPSLSPFTPVLLPPCIQRSTLVFLSLLSSPSARIRE